MKPEIKNVFISHVHCDDDGIQKLKELTEKHGLIVRDSSITVDRPNGATDPDYIKRAILAPQIQWASTLVVYISPQTKNSDYVNWEIEYAHKNNKRIVGVWSPNAGACEIPEALNRYGDALVSWIGEDVVAAIVGDCDYWCDRDGQRRSAREAKQANA
jgi:hypothetical protein